MIGPALEIWSWVELKCPFEMRMGTCNYFDIPLHLHTQMYSNMVGTSIHITHTKPQAHTGLNSDCASVSSCVMCSLWSCCTVVLLLKSVYKSRVAGIVTFKWWGSLAFFLWPSRPLSLSHSRSFPWVEINIAFLWLLYSCCNIYWIKPKRIWVQKTFVSYTRVHIVASSVSIIQQVLD